MITGEQLRAFARREIDNTRTPVRVIGTLLEAADALDAAQVEIADWKSRFEATAKALEDSEADNERLKADNR